MERLATTVSRLNAAFFLKIRVVCLFNKHTEARSCVVVRALRVCADFDDIVLITTCVCADTWMRRWTSSLLFMVVLCCSYVGSCEADHCSQLHDLRCPLSAGVARLQLHVRCACSRSTPCSMTLLRGIRWSRRGEAMGRRYEIWRCEFAKCLAMQHKWCELLEAEAEEERISWCSSKEDQPPAQRGSVPLGSL